MVTSTEDTVATLERALGGAVHDLRRVAGGASRVTSSFRHASPAGTTEELILQRVRGSGLGVQNKFECEATLLERSRAVGVPVPRVVASGERDGLPPGWLVVERLSGESIARKILRDDEWAVARSVLAAQCARALALIHTVDSSNIEGLPSRDPFARPLAVLDELGEVRPALELGVRWLTLHEPAMTSQRTVHGDFRLGNLLIDREGLCGVLDWELAHVGDPAEDIGWLSAPAWRFGGSGDVAGVGSLGDFLAAYHAAGGEEMDETRVRWWQVYATVKWAVICALQASSHLSGATRSLEHAAIGRRICECEWDLFVLLDMTNSSRGDRESDGRESEDFVGDSTLFGRPTAIELIEAVRETFESRAKDHADDRERFDARVARNALLSVERELRFGPTFVAAHRDRLAELNAVDDRDLAASLRRGERDSSLAFVGERLAQSARDQLLVANPSHLL